MLLGFSYWVLFIIIYYLLLEVIDDGGWLIIYIIIYPFLFFLPYKISKTEKIQKIKFILFNFLLPFIIIYPILIYNMLKSFKPSF